MNIFPEIKFTRSELIEIQGAFSLPSVVKYLNSMAYSAGTDICTGIIGDGESAESYLRRQEFVKGGLGVIDTLLKINAEKAIADISNSVQ